MSTPLDRLRTLGKIEAVSFLVLLLIAMPLKYIWAMPLAVKVVGWIHGALFVAFGFALLHVMLSVPWKITRAAAVFIAALIPFGPFVIDKRLEGEWAEPQK